MRKQIIVVGKRGNKEWVYVIPTKAKTQKIIQASVP